MTVMGFPDMPAALVGGSLDGAMLIEPFLVNVVERDIGVLWKRTDEISPNFQAAVVLYGPAILDQPDVARRFMAGYVKAARFYHQASNSPGSPAWQEVVDTLIKHTGVKDRAMYDRMVLPGLDPDALVNVETLRHSQDWWIERGLQQDRVDLDRAVDLSYARAAASQLGPAPR
jgi:NitT/TauT family transport system substrate-binding protein